MSDPLTPAAITRPVEDLTSALALAKSHHESGQRAERAGLEHYRKAGETLLKAKAAAGHGQWLPALRQSGIPQQRASEYMRLAEGWDKLPPGGNFTLKEALRRIEQGPVLSNVEDAVGLLREVLDDPDRTIQNVVDVRRLAEQAESIAHKVVIDCKAARGHPLNEWERAFLARWPRTSAVIAEAAEA